ncbi:MAG: ankyrin repeat domain-containing protein [Gemmatimonadota bacterium]|nr:MAG: ankyrin repeat domain-containing protein [Gemmatimonadota bacterium]
MSLPSARIRSVSLLLLFSIVAVPLYAQTIFDAARDGDVERLRELIAADSSLVRATDGDGRTALHHAANRGRVAAARMLLGCGAEIDALEEDRETPLHYAAWRSQLEMGRLLTQEGADLEARNAWGRTPLLIVARETGNADFARMLIEAGSVVTARDRGGQSSLDLAAWRGFAELVDLLLDSGAELPPQGSSDAQWIAMSAADKGLERLFNLCVDAGTDLGLRNEGNGSLLHSASQGGSATIVARLLDAGFDPNERDIYGRTPLHYAAELGREEATRMLVARGADVDARSLGGETAFNTAQSVGRSGVARLLVDAGADTISRQFPELAGPYMGQRPPDAGSAPTLFALDIVSTHRFQHGTIAFSPAGDEAMWSSQIAIQETGYSQGLMLFSRIQNGRWTEPAPAPFSRLGLGDDVPFYLPGGDRLYFLSVRLAPGEEPGQGERIWYVDRTADGWSEPQIVAGGPNTLDLHWEFSVAADTSIYVASRGELYVSRYLDGRYAEPESLGPIVNSEADEGMPFIAPDDSYLLFTRFRHPDNIGFSDLWISFPDEQGNWAEAVNLGERINSVAGICPIVTPDGRYLFFQSGNDDNYWVDAEFIERLRRER